MRRRAALVLPLLLLVGLLPLIPRGATAGAGWYLLTPPLIALSSGMVIARSELPLRAWEHAASFDTALACEERRERWAADARRVPSGPGWEAYREAADANLAARVMAEYRASAVARCIASDDPQLR